MRTSGHATSPVLFGRPRAGPRPFASRCIERRPSNARGWSAERRLVFESPPCGGGVPCDRHARHPALHLRRFVSLDPLFLLSVSSPCGSTRIREAFASVHLSHVQPLKAAPRSGGGRAPRASRKRGANPPAGAARPTRVSPSRLRTALDRGESPPRRPGCSTFRIASRKAPLLSRRKEYRQTRKGPSSLFLSFIPHPFVAWG